MAHRGNVHEAANVTGVPAATLRALHSGRSANPGLNTLKALAAPYGLSPGWFSGEEPNRLPWLGIEIRFRVKQPDGTYFDKRNVGIPWATWPLPGVFKRLSDHVVGHPGPERPIIGKLDPDNPTDAIDVKWKIAEFLLAPLLEQERAFGGLLVPDGAHDNADRQKIQRLRLLGLFWQDSLSPHLIDR
jgi:transcriptional regulator with XRE-family HTH domain